MDLKTHLKSLPDLEARDAFAKRVGTSLGHMTNVANGYKPCAPTLAVSIEQDTNRAVMRWDLRPEDWHRIWPELIGAEGAPPIVALEAKAA
jgi:DNA-binding transcriptional regulator YdaS (Cro superfamily)